MSFIVLSSYLLFFPVLMDPSFLPSIWLNWTPANWTDVCFFVFASLKCVSLSGLFTDGKTHCFICLPPANEWMQIAIQVLNQTRIWHPVLHVNGESCSAPLPLSLHSLIRPLPICHSAFFNFPLQSLSFRPPRPPSRLMAGIGSWMPCQTLRADSWQSPCPSFRSVQCVCWACSKTSPTWCIPSLAKMNYLSVSQVVKATLRTGPIGGTLLWQVIDFR